MMPGQQERKLSLQQFQSRRLRRDHADLAEEAQYRALAEFFFTEMYGPHDFSARDEQARRMQQYVQLAPGLAFNDVQNVLELLELTNQLDDAMARWLMKLAAPLDFDEQTYERAYRLADNYHERVRQLDLIRATLYSVSRMARTPMLGAVLARTHGLAQAIGMAELHRFLQAGYGAIGAVRDIQRFVETIWVRERDWLDRIYKP